MSEHDGPNTAGSGDTFGPDTVLEGNGTGPKTVLEGNGNGAKTVLEGNGTGPKTALEGNRSGPATATEGLGHGPETVADGNACGIADNLPRTAPPPRSIVFRGLRVVAMPGASPGTETFILPGNGTGDRLLILYGLDPSPTRGALKVAGALESDPPGRVVDVIESGYDASLGRYFEIQERTVHGTLAEIIAAGRSGRIDFMELVSELCESLDAIHSADLVHRDVKPANVVVRSLEPLAAVLSGFGLSSAMRGLSVRETRRAVTPEYAPPESVLASKAGDWWCMGVALYEFLTGKVPFAGLPREERDALVATVPVPFPDGIAPDREILLKGLLTRDMDRRWRAPQIREWISGRVPEVFFEGPAALKPFSFRGTRHGTLASLVSAFASSDENWKAAAEYVGKGYLRRTLEERGDGTGAEEVEALACAEADVHVFRIVHAFLPDPKPSYRGLALTGEVLCAALASPADPAQTDLAERALDGRLASMAAFLIERGIAADPLFLNAALSAVSVPPESRRQWLVKVLACSLRPELFFWGGLELSDGVRRYAPLMEGAGAGAVECGAPGAFLRAADLAGDVLAKSEISRMGGGRLSIPQGVSAMLSSPLTYLRGAADLRDRYSRKRLVAADTGDPQGPPSVFPGTDADYDAKADEASSGRDPEGISDVLKAGKALLPFRPSANGPDSEIAVLQDFASFLALTDEPLADGDAEACREIAGILDSLPGRMFSFHLAKRYPGCPYAGYAVTIAMLALALLTAGSRFLDSPFCMPFCVSAALSLLDTAFYVPFLFVKAEIGRLADRARWRMAS